MTRAARAGAWIGGLAVAGTLLHVAGTGDLAAPPLGAPAELVTWVEAREPVTAFVALGRLLAEAVVWYVLAVSALHVAAGLLRRREALRLADAIAVGWVSRLVRGGLGVTLVATTALPSAAAQAPHAASATAEPVPADRSPAAPTTAAMTPTTQPPAAALATMAPIETASTTVSAPSAPSASSPTSTTSTTAGTAVGPGTATMRPVPATPAPGARHAPPAEPAPIPVPPPPATTWTVSPGESLWTIAEERLAEAWGRTPTDAEVDPHWRALVEHNRARLADPADPDLLHPGQVLDLPPLS